MKRSDEIQREIDSTRDELGDTVDALGAKADVPGRAKGWLADKKDAVTSKVGGATSAVSDAAPDGRQVRRRLGRLRSEAERNPLGLVAGGAAVGFVAGLITPSTRMEDERIGPMADDVKQAAVETGHEAIDRGMDVAQDAGRSAVDTVKARGEEAGDELGSTLRDKVRDVGSSREAQSPGEEPTVVSARSPGVSGTDA